MEANDLDELECRILVAAYHFEFGDFLNLFAQRDLNGELPRSPAGLKGRPLTSPSVPRCMLYVASYVDGHIEETPFNFALRRLRGLDLIRAVKSPIGSNVFHVAAYQLKLPHELLRLSPEQLAERAKTEALEWESYRFYPYSMWRIAQTGWLGADVPLFLRTYAEPEDSERHIDEDLFVAELVEEDGSVIESASDCLYDPHFVLARPEGVRIARSLVVATVKSESDKKYPPIEVPSAGRIVDAAERFLRLATRACKEQSAASDQSDDEFEEHGYVLVAAARLYGLDVPHLTRALTQWEHPVWELSENIEKLREEVWKIRHRAKGDTVAGALTRSPTAGTDAHATMYLVLGWHDSVTGEESIEPIVQIEGLSEQEHELLFKALYDEMKPVQWDELAICKLEDRDAVERLRWRKKLAENAKLIDDYERAGETWAAYNPKPCNGDRWWVERIAKIRKCALSFVSLIKAERGRVTGQPPCAGGGHCLELSESKGGATAILNGKSYVLKRRDAVPFLRALLRDQPNPVKLGAAGVPRPDRVYKTLPPVLQELIEKPGRGQAGYRFKVPVTAVDEGPTKMGQAAP